MAMQMVLDVPEALVELSSEEREGLFRAGLREALAARAKQIEEEIAEAVSEAQVFADRYQMGFERFERERLQESDNLQIHEDYNDWFYWTSVLAEKQKLLASLHKSGHV